MSAFRIAITTGSGTPIYRPIVDQVRLGVATEPLLPGNGTADADHVLPPNYEFDNDRGAESDHVGSLFLAAERRHMVPGHHERHDP
ncbi:MAG TPA: hypothetical protein VKU02_10620 [Gemmataceae bacterium]|nr:hypothetical protein [Gemmataceae bacterium]